uniref:MKRN2 opposite strand, tandem duplicate 2 n=1 Tax=Nippostrongylus brasiliensis TaxID=27835 RepID=A0A0N4XCU7_NIPBR
LRSEPVPSPFVQQSSFGCAVVVKPTRGGFSQYNAGDDLHIGITDSTSTVYSYWTNGISAEGGGWDGSIVVLRFRDMGISTDSPLSSFMQHNREKFAGTVSRFLYLILPFMSSLEASLCFLCRCRTSFFRFFISLSSFQLYNDSSWNCFDFVMEFLRFIGIREYTKADFVSEFVQSALNTAIKYATLLRKVEECGILVLH